MLDDDKIVKHALGVIKNITKTKEVSFTQWMKDIPSSLQFRSLYHINLPGIRIHPSHTNNTPFTRLKRYIRENILKRVQSVIDIGDILRKGIRYIDLKVVYDRYNDNFICVIGDNNVDLAVALYGIRRFVEEHKTEVVLIQLTLDFGDRNSKVNSNKYQEFVRVETIRMIENILDNYLHRYTGVIDIPSYNEIKELRNSVLLFSDDFSNNEYCIFWPSWLLNVKNVKGSQECKAILRSNPERYGEIIVLDISDIKDKMVVGNMISELSEYGFVLLKDFNKL